MKFHAALLASSNRMVWQPLRMALIVCIVGVVAAMIAMTVVDHRQRVTREHAFDVLTQRASEQFKLRLRLHEYQLRSTRSAVLAIGPDQLTRLQFKNYFTSSNFKTDFPGVLGYGLIRRVPLAKEKAFIESARRDGAPDFAIRQFSPHQGDRWIIQYIEPAQGNQAALGLDLASEQSRLDSVNRAILSGEPTLTTALTLVQAGQKLNQGFLLLLPIYASNRTPEGPEARQRDVVALTYSPWLIDQFLEQFDFRNDEFAMRIMAPNSSGQLVEIYQSKYDESPADISLIKVKKISLYGQTWQVEFIARPNFIAGLNQTNPQWIGAQVLLLSWLLAALLYAYLVYQRRKLQNWIDTARMGGVMRYANDAIIGLDLAGKVTSWNQAAVSIFGYSEHQAHGHSIEKLIVPESLVEEKATVQKAVVSGESVGHFITQRRCQDGQLIHVGVTAFPIKEDQHSVVGSAMIIRDVTQQVLAEEQVRVLNANLEHQVAVRTGELDLARRDLQTIFDAMPSMIGYWDKDLRNRVANKAYENWFACDPRTLKGIHIRDLLGEAGYQDNLPFIEGALRGEVQTFERTWPSIEGQPTRHTQAHYLPDVVNGEVLGFYVIVNDVTETFEYRLQLEASLRHNEILLSTISQQMLYSVTDTRGRILEVNDNFCRVSGFSREELIGQNHRMINSAYHPPEFWQQMWRKISNGEAWHEEVCNRNKSGEFYWVDSVISPFIGASGKIERYVSLRSDITQRKKAESELARVLDLLSNVLKAASEISIIATDAAGKITLFNAGAEVLLGCEANDRLGADMASTIHCNDELAQRSNELSTQYGRAIQGFRALVHCAEEQGVEVREWDYLRRNGTRVRVSLAMTVMRDSAGHITGYLAIAQDITQRIEKDRALREAKRFAEHANEAKSAFLANMSHEIRTPLNGIMGICHILQKQHMPAVSQNLVHKIHIASQSLLSIINDVLDFSKIEANRLEIEQTPFRLSELIDNLSSIARGTIQDKDVSIIVKQVPEHCDYLIGDPLRLGQILTNLLSNAVKFTHQGNITLSINLLEQSDEDKVRLRFVIKDTGIGISEDKLKLIFDAFSQADTSTSRSYGGSGLGLTICRRLATLMGGTVTVESEMGKGSRFILDLPFVLAEHSADEDSINLAAQAASQAEQTQRLQGVRILIVDDSELNREVADYILKSEGAVVDSAVDGLDAVTQLQGHERNYDVVLMDIQMPNMDGYQAAREIRAMTHRSAVPIIALTAGAMASQRKAALEAGMNGFVAKPFDVDQLIATVKLYARQPTLVETSVESDKNDELQAALQAFQERFLQKRLPSHLKLVNGFLANDASVSLVQVRSALHAIAGEAGMVGLSGMGDHARQLETLIDGNVITDDQLREQLKELAEFIQATIDGPV